LTGLVAPFPYFGGKRSIAETVWARFGAPIQYIEPFCGSAAMLLAAPKPASLEVISDWNGFVANFWRAVTHQPDAVSHWADYPVSHIDLTARHVWLTAQRARLTEALTDAEWPGDSKVAGWWLWGQCAWIGEGWCEWDKELPGDRIPAIGNRGMGIHAISADAQFWLKALQRRLRRVRILHGDWTRCLNHNCGGDSTAVFLDPPYSEFENVYSDQEVSLSQAVAQWARENENLRIALCGHSGDYSLSGWDVVSWTRPKGMCQNKTRDLESIWFSPGCLKLERGLFSLGVN
jgi:hypothetical protein